jgi:hypothetical protein
MAAAGLIGVASPAFAAPPTVTITDLSSGNIAQGDAPATLKFSVTNAASAPTQIEITSTVEGLIVKRGSSTCPCTFTESFASKDYSVTLTVAPGVIPPGQSRTGDVNIKATSNPGTPAAEVGTAHQAIIARGPNAISSVPEVSGEVVNVFDATPVPSAVVYMQDSAGKNFETGTDKQGKFKFTSTADKPIAAGALALRVEKDGWETSEKPIVAAPGQPVAAHLTLRPLNVSPSAALPGASPTGDVTPIDGGGLGTSSPNEKEGGISWLLIVVGAVLVLLGIGAIALLFLRRRDEGDDDRTGPRKPPGRMPPGRGGPPVGPGGRPMAHTRRMPEGAMRGAPDPRRGPPPGRPVSPGPRADQTLIARSPLADQPTMAHGRLPSEHADPYTSPGRHNGAPGGYGAPAGGYGGTPSSGYAGGHSYGQPSDPYAQQYPDPYAGGGGQYEGYGQPGPDPRGRTGQPPGNRRVDWLDD